MHQMSHTAVNLIDSEVTMRIRITRSKCLAGLVILCFLCLMIFGIGFVTDSDIFGIKMTSAKSERADEALDSLPADSIAAAVEPGISSAAGVWNMQKKVESNPSGQTVTDSDVKYPSPNYDVHLFYYPWYGAQSVDGKYMHWNHRYLPHWLPNEAKKWPDGRHVPPDDIGANFYPRLGPYSSRDPAVLEDHMRQIRTTGAGVLAVSWYPPGTADDEGDDLDSVLPTILDHAEKYSLKVCIHIEPYKNRNHKNMKENLKYILNKYGNHSAFYRRPHPSGRSLPLYYMYDSYLVPDGEWRELLLPDSTATVRNTDLDGIFIGLVVEKPHALSLVSSGFDGFYTYFASDGFTFGSNIRNWGFLSVFAKERNVLFIPSVGPGYIDERIRPWNSANTKSRRNGDYYEHSFEAALNVAPPVISITSFNEWHEGTQIEEAIPKDIGDFKYLDYMPREPQYYLMLTRKWVFKFRRRSGISDAKVMLK